MNVFRSELETAARGAARQIDWKLLVAFLVAVALILIAVVLIQAVRADRMEATPPVAEKPTRTKVFATFADIGEVEVWVVFSATDHGWRSACFAWRDRVFHFTELPPRLTCEEAMADLIRAADENGWRVER